MYSIANRSARDQERCVFNLDQDIVEVQTTLLELGNGARARLHIDMFNPGESKRHIRILGADGVIDGCFEDGRFDVSFNDARGSYTVEIEGTRAGHGGGDARAVAQFVKMMAKQADPGMQLRDALLGMRTAAAAEQSRASGGAWVELAAVS